MIIEKIKKHFEKVKLGLECCTERYSRCRECPYDQRRYGFYSNACEGYLREDLVELFNLIDFERSVSFVLDPNKLSDMFTPGIDAECIEK